MDCDKTAQDMSLHYRRIGDWQAEQHYVEKALSDFPDSAYLLERKKWHERPLFHEDITQCKLFYRSPIDFGETAPRPDQSVLERTCIVSGSCSKYFPLLVELLESIRATRTYKNIAVGLFDCGLLDEQKHFLLKTFNIHAIVKPDWDIKAYACLPEGSKDLVARAFMPQYFKGFRYYFHIDADSWVQDENGVHQFLNLAIQQGIGGGLSGFKTMDAWPHFGDGGNLCEGSQNRPLIMASTICIDVKSGFFDKWADMYKNMAQSQPKGRHIGADLLSLSLIYGDQPYLNIESDNPCQYIDKGILYNPHGPCGIVRLSDYTKWYRYKILVPSKTGELLTTSVAFRTTVDWKCMKHP